MTNINKRFKVDSKYETFLKSFDKMQLYFDTKVSESVPFIQYASFCSTLTVQKTFRNQRQLIQTAIWGKYLGKSHEVYSSL